MLSNWIWIKNSEFPQNWADFFVQKSPNDQKFFAATGIGFSYSFCIFRIRSKRNFSNKYGIHIWWALRQECSVHPIGMSGW